MGRGEWFKGRQFTTEVILWAVRWYLMFPISYRDLALMLLDRGVEVDHTTIFRWSQAYAAELEKRIRPHLRTSNGSAETTKRAAPIAVRCVYSGMARTEPVFRRPSTISPAVVRMASSPIAAWAASEPA